MPYVNVQVAGKLTKEQKTELASRISIAIEEVTGKPRDVTYIAFDEYSRENFAVGEHLLSDMG